MPGPRKNLTPLDMKMMGLAFNQGGIINFLGKQPEVTAPVRAQSHADSPPVQLAYITDAEKDLLVKSNIHGSMDGKPNPGPAGLPSLDDFFNVPGGGIGGGSTANATQPDRPDDPVLGGGGYTGSGSQSGNQGGGTSAEDYGIQPGMAVGSDGTVYNTTDFVPAPGQADKPGSLVEVLPDKQKELEALAEAKRLETLKNLGIITPDYFSIFKDQDTGVSGIDTFFKNAYNKLTGGNLQIPGLLGAFGNIMKGIKPTVESFNDPLFLARMRTQFENEEDFNNYFDKYKNLMEEAYAGQGDVEEEFKDRMESAFGAAQAGDLGTDAFRETNPTKFYEDFTPQTSGDLVDLAGLDASMFKGTDLADKIFAARMELDRMGKNPMTGESQGAGQTGVPQTGQANIIEPTQFGAFIGKPGPFIGNFVDTDGDGVDDRFQTGPGQPRQPFVNPKAPLPGTSGIAQAVGVPAALNYANIAPQFTGYTNQGVSPMLGDYYGNLRRFYG
jgi:hypothetical protein